MIRGPNHRPAVIDARKIASVSGPSTARGAVTVDHGDGQPVVAGALGEGQAHDEQADQQRPRFGPRLERVAWLARGVVGVLRARFCGPQEPPGGQRDGDPEGQGHRQQMDHHRHAERHHDRAHGGSADGPDAEAGVELRHDRPPQTLLDGRALDVHGHVPDAVAEADQGQPDDRRGDADQRADGHHREADRQADRHDRPRCGRRRAGPR